MLGWAGFNYKILEEEENEIVRDFSNLGAGNKTENNEYKK